MKIKLKNRLDVLMKDQGVATFEEMAERLTNHQGWSITRSALSRKFRDDNVTLTLKMIEAICNELQCLPGDLFETQIENASESDLSTIQNRLLPFKYGNITKQAGNNQNTDALGSSMSTVQQKKAKEIVDLSDVLGPSVSHLSHDKIKGS
ncbi:helix-turn-helix domain-containing protein [Aliidiomarina quisquiliarum]|uniref:helix-turn-helix domain-containing protein n=1 Tax=Aliidiomarina quisquiliarum TaxID=2938947 RepID=UPI00208E4B72|nr:helix-turn-helix transcriptional regulator [Aliidiomarina quisquiliarum]MCO4322310.1 helix-turn-helix transcriptional regulator [Aliidiomarina quisquiliarum]